MVSAAPGRAGRPRRTESVCAQKKPGEARGLVSPVAGPRGGQGRVEAGAEPGPGPAAP